MGWFGKIVGGGIGFSLGGPLGAMLGATIGHLFDAQAQPRGQLPGAGSGSRGPFAPPTANEERQAAFFVSTFALLGKMAKADGVVHEDEIGAVEAYMTRLGFDERRRRLAIGVFRRAKDDALSHVDYAQAFAAVFGAAVELKQELMEILQQVAQADGQIHPNEARMLDDVARCLGLDGSGSEAGGSGNRRTASTDDPTRRAYELLGCQPEDSWETIKSRYRQLVHKFHPDRLESKGLPEEFQLFAKQKLQDINSAYETLQTNRRGPSSQP